MGTLLFWDGKGEQFIMLQLPEPALIAIRALPDLSQATFAAMRSSRTQSATSSSGRTMLRPCAFGDACKEAGVRYHMHKEAGRHAFVTKCL